MDKFSKIVKDNNKLTNEIEDFVYDGYIKVKSKDGWEYVKESDCAIGLVHLLDFNEILLRKEIVPPFQERHPNQEFFLTIISGTIDGNETPIQTITRELVEEAGISLNTNYNNFENMGEYFWCKGNTSKCHIFYIPLRTNEFQKVYAKGDGSEAEKLSKTVKVDLKYLESLKPSDLVTSLCLQFIKNKI